MNEIVTGNSERQRATARSGRRSCSMTMLVVTHGLDEYLADRVVVLDRSQSRVLEVVEVGLPAERDQIDTKSSSRFVDLRRHVASLFRRRPEAVAV